tara:strand:- start:2497 stop:2733 length:237 start_codon:yes stop_codon:yes gene_type:complete
MSSSSALQFSFLDCNKNSFNNIRLPDQGLGLYTGTISEKWAPSYITPTSTEFMKQFYAKTHNPSYTRLGNNTEPETKC